MIVSELKNPHNGMLNAVVRSENISQHSSVEEYIYAFDLAACKAGYRLAGRPAWRMVSQEPETIEISICVLPDFDLPQYLERTVMCEHNAVEQQILCGRLTEMLALESDFVVPTLAIDTEADRQWQLLQERLVKSKITLQQHLSRLRMTEEQFRTKLRGYAEADVKKRIVLLAVARAEGLLVTEEELHEAVLDAQRHGIQLPDRMQLRQKLLAQKAVDRIWQSTNVVQHPAQEEQP